MLFCVLRGALCSGQSEDELFGNDASVQKNKKNKTPKPINKQINVCSRLQSFTRTSEVTLGIILWPQCKYQKVSLINHSFGQTNFNFLQCFTPFFSSLTICVVLVFLGRSLMAYTQSRAFGPPSIIFHKSLMNLLKVLVETLFKFALDLEVCCTEIFQMDLWPLRCREGLL